MMKIIDAHVHLVQCICGFGSRGELRAIGEGKARYADGSVISLIQIGRASCRERVFRAV